MRSSVLYNANYFGAMAFLESQFGELNQPVQTPSSPCFAALW
jgi:hypothetical protein